MDGQGAEEPASPEDTDESAAAESQERDGTPAAGVAESSDSSGEPASETAEVDPPAPREDSSTDSDVDLNADTVTQRAAAYATESTDLSEEAARGWHEGDLVANQYRIQKLIGQGGMGKVYLAQDAALDRPVALKRIPQEIIFDVDARDDLRLEANRLLDLAHDNIIRIHTYSDGPTWPFFAMEYLEGQTLKHLLRQRKREGRTFEAEELLVHPDGEVLEHPGQQVVGHRTGRLLACQRQCDRRRLRMSDEDRQQAAALGFPEQDHGRVRRQHLLHADDLHLDHRRPSRNACWITREP